MSFIPYQYILHGNMWQLTLSAQYLQHLELRIITVRMGLSKLLTSGQDREFRCQLEILKFITVFEIY